MKLRRAALVTTSFAFFACGGSTPPEEHPPIAPTSSASMAAPIASSAAPPTVASSSEPPPPPPPKQLTFKEVPLPAGTGDASFDYVAYEPANDRVWLPYARDAAYVDVYDVAKGAFARVAGFKSKVVETKDKKKRAMGPSAAAVGDDVVYVGDRATSEVCAVDEKTLKKGACVTLTAPPDGLAYVASAKELWVTTPKTKSLAILDVSKPAAPKAFATLKLEGQPEGFAVDDAKGVFFTNYEDADKTLRTDVATRTLTTSWSPACGEEGPRGLRVDSARGLVIVSCTDHVQVLDANDGGTLRGKLDTGAGVDDLAYDASTKRVYVAAGKAAKLTIARLDDDGSLTTIAIGDTSARARNAVIDAKGNAYVVDPVAPRLLVFAAP